MCGHTIIGRLRKETSTGNSHCPTLKHSPSTPYYSLRAYTMLGERLETEDRRGVGIGMIAPADILTTDRSLKVVSPVPSKSLSRGPSNGYVHAYYIHTLVSPSHITSWVKTHVLLTSAIGRDPSSTRLDSRGYREATCSLGQGLTEPKKEHDCPSPDHVTPVPLAFFIPDESSSTPSQLCSSMAPYTNQVWRQRIHGKKPRDDDGLVQR